MTQQGKGKDGRLKICILSTGPGKTLGDAALCEKLAASLFEKYNVEIDTRIHLIEESQVDKAQNLFKPFDHKYPGQHHLTLERGNLGFDHPGFDPDDYDLIIPFAAYNLFEDDFKLKTQFFSEKPNMGFIKTDQNIHALIKSKDFQKKHQALNTNRSNITFIQLSKGNMTKTFAYFKNAQGKHALVPIDPSQKSLFDKYFKNMDPNVYYAFDEKDYLRAADFEVTHTTPSGVRVVSSKKPHFDAEIKAPYFDTAYQMQDLVKDLATKHLGHAPKYKCIYLTRYDYFSDDYIHSLKPSDVEYLGIDRGYKYKYDGIFSNGEIQNIQTGFGSNKHGIMLPHVPSEVSLQSVEDIKRYMNTEDIGVVDLLYGNNSKQAYEHSNELFFGYHNIIPNTDISALPVKGYVQTCLDITSKTRGKENKNVDFVLNIYPDNGDASDTCKLSEVIKGIDLNKYDVEFWKKNADNKMEKCQSIGECNGAKPLVRLINPFGIKHESFLTLLRVAEPLTLQTGNSSIIEAFYLGKLPLYQLTSWSTDFLDALEKYTSDTLGAHSHYATIFRTANDRNLSQQDKVARISDIYRNHMSDLRQELTNLVCHMKENMDLYKNLPKILQDKFNIPLVEKRPEANTMPHAVPATIPASEPALCSPIFLNAFVQFKSKNTPICNVIANSLALIGSKSSRQGRMVPAA
jgi:hypothetical protein